MPDSRSAFLYMYRAHCGDSNMAHKNAVETLARSRTDVWIHKGKNLAKVICRNCPICIKNRKILSSQQMARLKPQALEICRPWTFVSLDFAGPITF